MTPLIAFAVGAVAGFIAGLLVYHANVKLAAKAQSDVASIKQSIAGSK
jgi:hypothetical protein